MPQKVKVLQTQGQTDTDVDVDVGRRIHPWPRGRTWSLALLGGIDGKYRGNASEVRPRDVAGTSGDGRIGGDSSCSAAAAQAVS